MEVRRSSFSVAVLDGNIYAIGGHCDTDYIESVERYSPAANSWRYTGSSSSKGFFVVCGYRR